MSLYNKWSKKVTELEKISLSCTILKSTISNYLNNVSQEGKWCRLLLYMSHKAAISMANIISQWCGDLQLGEWVSDCQGEMETFEDHPSIQPSETSHSKKQLGSISAATMPVRTINYCVQLSFDGEKCSLHAWELAFVKSNHKYLYKHQNVPLISWY